MSENSLAKNNTNKDVEMNVTEDVSEFVENFYRSLLDSLIDDAILDVCFDVKFNKDGTDDLIPVAHERRNEVKEETKTVVQCPKCHLTRGTKYFTTHLSLCMGLSSQRKASQKRYVFDFDEDQSSGTDDLIHVAHKKNSEAGKIDVVEDVKSKKPRNTARKSFVTRPFTPLNVKSTENVSLGSDDTDVTFRVRGEEFQLRKSIVRACSPVFCAMLEHDMREKRTGIITVVDCEVNTFRMFVNYLYSGTVENLTKENVFDLYEIADKYLVVRLKEECIVFIKNMLSADTVYEVFTFAMHHKDVHLLRAASKFFSNSYFYYSKEMEKRFLAKAIEKYEEES